MKRIFPLAAYSYFRITNKAEQKRRFLDDDTYNPEFEYHDHFDIDIVQGHISRAVHDASKQSLELVLASINLQKEKPSKAAKETFRSLNKSLYGAPNHDYVQAILGRIESRVTPESAELWDYVLKHVEYHGQTAQNIIPDHETFNTYRNYFRKYNTLPLEKSDLTAGLERALKQTGLSDKGWTVHLLDDAIHARVDHLRKRVVIGEHYHPRTSKAAQRIIVHEVYGHALRGLQESMAESEGVAILFEQLIGKRFKFRRAYRYLAATLGWGEAGGPRTFREVYEIIWRLMVIASRYTEENAKSHAFDECVRVFRGGRPDIAGAVFLKDIIYFDGNVAVWQKLEKEPLAYNEFVDVIEGRRKVLK
jgi:hypothetical protein